MKRTRLCLLAVVLLVGLRGVAQAQTISTYAGGGAVYGDNGPATSAQIGLASGVAIDQAGNLYFADSALNVVRRVDHATGIITTIAGTGGAGYTGDGGPGTLAALSAPTAVAVDLAGNVYFTDTLNSVVRKVDMTTGIISTVAGDGNFAYSGDGGLATSASLTFPDGVAVNAAGDIFIADTSNFVVRKVSAATGIITTIAGHWPFSSSSGDGSLATAARFTQPERVAVDGGGNVFILDVVSASVTRVRRIDAATGIINTVAGGAAGDGTSGAATGASLSGASDLAVDSAGNLYVVGAVAYNVVWKADMTTGVISVIAGVGPAGFSGDGGPAALATFNGLSAVAVAGDGSIYLSDGGNGRIRKIAAPVAPPADIVYNGTSATTITVSGPTTVTGNLTVTNNANATSIDISGVTTVGGSVTINGNTAATSVSTGSLGSAGGNVTISGNTAAATVSTGSLGSAGGNVTISGNTAAATVSTGSLGSAGGNVTISGNTAAATVSTGSLGSAGGNVTITGNTSATSVNAVATTISGNLTITNNGSATLTVGPATGTAVAGNTTISTGGGTGDYSTISTTGSVSISGNGTTTVNAQTGATGTTTVSLVNGEAAMTAALPTGAFASPVAFSIQHLDPATLPPVQGLSATSVPVTVDPVSAYQFTFAIPTLNSPATLTFEINVGALAAADQTTFLAALASGNATLAVQGDAAGSVYQAFAVCSPTQLPAGGCAQVAELDATKTPLPFGSTATPAFVRFVGIAGHFSTYAVVVLSPITPAIATIAGQTGSQGVAFSFAPSVTNPSALTLTFSNAGSALPAGLSVNAGTGAITGTPSVSGTFAGIQLRATYTGGSVMSNAFSIVLSPASSTTGSSRAICTTLGGTPLPDLDLFQFTASAAEKVTVTVAASPTGSHVNGSALLTLFGTSVLQIDGSALPNVVSATLSKAGTYYVTVSELLLKSGKFSGAYCVTLASSKNAWQTFVKR